ncbi:MAG: hypothetical protein GPJ14_26110 [Microcystis aeruginosa G11-01]|nr:hypothetical protein [Microcystis aeruginosa G11-01]
MRKKVVGLLIILVLLSFIFFIFGYLNINTKDPKVQKKYLNEIKSKISIGMPLNKAIEVLQKDGEYYCESYTTRYRDYTFCNKTALFKHWSIYLEIANQEVINIKTKVFDPDFVL